MRMLPLSTPLPTADVSRIVNRIDIDDRDDVAGHFVLPGENIAEVTVNYYLMDIELLFSRQPFVQQYSSHFSFVQPNQTSTINLPPTKKTYRFALPAELANEGGGSQETRGRH